MTVACFFATVLFKNKASFNAFENTLKEEEGKMTLEREQRIFDDVKWFESVRAKSDLCGSYAFCGACNKNLSYPCARASRLYSREVFRVATVILKRGDGKNE